MSKTNVHYENNPFMIGIEGLKLIFTKSKGVGIYSIVLTAAIFAAAFLSYLISFVVELVVNGQIDTTTDTYMFASLTFSEFLVLAGGWLIGLLVYTAVSLLLFGPLEYAAAMAAKGKSSTLKEAFKATLNNYPQYLWLYILFIVKVFLWSLLFIIPGIIMLNRYLLSGTVFFAEGKRGNAAIKRSAELTKGAWLTTYAGVWVWNMLSQGIGAFVFWPASVSVLYRQLAAATDAGVQKPQAHIISWLALLLPIVLTMLSFIFGVVVVLLVASMQTAP